MRQMFPTTSHRVEEAAAAQAERFADRGVAGRAVHHVGVLPRPVVHVIVLAELEARRPNASKGAVCSAQTQDWIGVQR